MEQNKPNYIGSRIKAIDGKYGEFLAVELKKADLQELGADRYGYIKLVIRKRREADQYGNTHYAVEDKFEPKEKTLASGHQAVVRTRIETPEVDPDDNPFTGIGELYGD